jgi:AcrR family transcriptional regulator
MQNSVPSSGLSARSLAARSVDRTLERRRAAAAGEVHRLIDASFALIRKTGNLEPKVGEIVRVAGLSNQAFYKHFRSKDELLVAVLDEGIRKLSGYLRHRMQKAQSSEQRIRDWIAGMLEQALNREAAAATRPFALSRARLAELFPAEVAESEAQLTAMLREVIHAAVATGELPDADPVRDAETIYGLAMGWVQRKLAGPLPPKRADAEHLIEFAMRGLGRGAKPARSPAPSLPSSGSGGGRGQAATPYSGKRGPRTLAGRAD